jgi:predicted transcriptional regulator
VTLPVHPLRKAELCHLSLRVEKSRIAKLDEIAAAVDRDRTYLIKEAIDEYLAMKFWQIDEIRKGITEADARTFSSEKDMDSLLTKWTR